MVTLVTAGKSLGGTIVIANRSAAAVRFTIHAASEQRPYALEPQGMVVVPADGPVMLRIDQRSYPLEPDSAHQFASDNGPQVRLQSISHGPESPTTAAVPNDAQKASRDGAARSQFLPARQLKLPVKILVDDEENAARTRWEDRLRERVQAASRVLEVHCGVGLEPVEIETWDSDDQFTKYERSLEEFQQEVSRGTARIAIGFSRQHAFPRGIVQPATKPLASHILICDGSTEVSEPERLEALIHEVGHFLGAVHSSHSTSVMRPKLGDRQALAQTFTIGFDPLNALAINLVAEELSADRVGGIADLSPYRKQRLAGVYAILAQSLPVDTEIQQRLAELPDSGSAVGVAAVQPGATATAKSNSITSPPRAMQTTGQGTVLVAPSSVGTAKSAVAVEEADVRSVLSAVLETARENTQRPLGRRAGKDELFRRTADELVEHYVRVAAQAARSLPQAARGRAFLAGMATALNTADAGEATSGVLPQIETSAQRDDRIGIMLIAPATVEQNEAAAQRFFQAAGAAARVGPAQALELVAADIVRAGESDSQQVLAHLCAAAAGVALAEDVLADRITMAGLARSFTIGDYLVDIETVQHELGWASSSDKLPSDEELSSALRVIRQHTAQLKAGK